MTSLVDAGLCPECTQLSQMGLAVLASLHQPNLSTYHAFNKCMFLHQGRLVYGGASNGPDTDFLHSLGYSLPVGANPADFFIESKWLGSLARTHYNKLRCPVCLQYASALSVLC